jgi:uridine phosphorylase
MSTTEFVPHHVNARARDFEGNNGIGRYVFVPGSDGRARDIASHFSDVRELPSPRCHNIYLGTLDSGSGPIDVAAVSTGMGCPSVDIIINELHRLGARRFLRVGTSGSCQKKTIRVGALVVATAAVRDEGTSPLYVPREYPAVASPEYVDAARRAGVGLGLEDRMFFGIVHSKDSLFAREFGEGPLSPENRRYMHVLEESGVVSSEMEASLLFVLTSLLDAKTRWKVPGPAGRVLAGTVLGIIGDDRPFAPPDEAARAIRDTVALALETTRELATLEREQAARRRPRPRYRRT